MRCHSRSFAAARLASIALAALVVLLGAFQLSPVARAEGGAFVVNSSLSNGGDADALTLHEAILVAVGRGGRTWSSAEKNQLGGCLWERSFDGRWAIRGGCGYGVPDRITFDPAITRITLTEPLPALEGLDGAGTWIDGTTVRPRIDARQLDDGDLFLVTADYVTISNLAIVNGAPSADPSTPTAAIIAYGGKGTRIAYNHIGTVAGAEGCRPAGVTRNSDIGVLITGGTRGTGAVGDGSAYVYGNTIGCALSGVTSFGADWVSVGQAPDGTVAGNFVGVSPAGTPLPMGSAGIYLAASGTNAVRYNRLRGNTVAYSGDGINIVGTGTHSSSYTWQNSIQGNHLHHNLRDGIRLSNAASWTHIDGDGGVPNVIDANGGHGITVDGSNAVEVIGNLIGTNATGTAAAPNGAAGIHFTGGAANGLVADNVIGGNAWAGVWLEGARGTTIRGNRIGTTADGSGVLANGHDGVALTAGARDNLVGGATAAERNLIGGNTRSGVYLADTGTSGNRVQGNWIGLNAAGSGALPNQNGVMIAGGAIGNQVRANRVQFNRNLGVWLTGATTTGNTIQANIIRRQRNTGVQLDGGAYGNLVGAPAGSTKALGNLIAGNAREGIYVAGTGTRANRVYRNMIGTNAKGLSADGNGRNGILITSGATANRIGLGLAERNVIAGNGLDGVALSDGASGNLVQGNYLGLSAAGTAALPNLSGVAILAGATNNVVGGVMPEQANVISGNRAYGVYIGGAGATRNLVDANLIGLDGSGMVAYPNGQGGIAIVDTPGPNTVGSTAAGVLQFIAGNHGPGVLVRNAGATLIGASNRIGVAADGTTALGNGSHGALLDNATTTRVLATLIAYNGGAGVAVTGDGALRNIVQPAGGSGNGGMLIDLAGDGPTANDAGDGDGGPNARLNFPTVTGASGAVLTGQACASCRVLVYRAIGSVRAAGGGGEYLGEARANSSGGWSADLAPYGVGRRDVTLVAIAPNGNTSEMSPRP